MTIRRPLRHRIIAGAALSVVAFSLAQAQDGERVVPIDKVLLSNRLNDPVNVLLLPDVGTYQLGAAKPRNSPARSSRALLSPLAARNTRRIAASTTPSRSAGRR